MKVHLCRFPVGGFFIWLRLPPAMDTAELLPRASDAGVGYGPGPRFHLDDSGANMLRLAFGLYPPEQLIAAAKRLGVVLRAG